MTKLTLEELALSKNEKTKINFLITNGKAFSKHYSINRDNMLKLFAWGLYAEGGLKLSKKSWPAGFAEFGKVDPRAPPVGCLKIPYKIISQLGYKKGDYPEALLIYAERLEDNNLNFYVARRPHHQISKKEYREIEEKVDKALSDR